MWSVTGKSPECLKGSWQAEGRIRELHGTQAGALGAGLSRREVRGALRHPRWGAEEAGRYMRGPEEHEAGWSPFRELLVPNPIRRAWSPCVTIVGPSRVYSSPRWPELGSLWAVGSRQPQRGGQSEAAGWTWASHTTTHICPPRGSVQQTPSSWGRPADGRPGPQASGLHMLGSECLRTPQMHLRNPRKPGCPRWRS